MLDQPAVQERVDFATAVTDERDDARIIDRESAKLLDIMACHLKSFPLPERLVVSEDLR